jgi:hypothetical protein
LAPSLWVESLWATVVLPDREKDTVRCWKSKGLSSRNFQLSSSATVSTT